MLRIFRPGLRPGLAHFAVPPFPTANAALVCRGGPGQATGSSVPFIPAYPTPPATNSSSRRSASAASAHAPYLSPRPAARARSLCCASFPHSKRCAGLPRGPRTGDWLLSSVYSSVSSSACHKFIFASLGIRQSPRGLMATEPILGPSGTQLRLNCWVKNRR